MEQKRWRTNHDVWVDADRLVFQTTLLFKICTLGLYHRMVAIDRTQRAIIMQSTKFWTNQSYQTISFDRIDRVHRDCGESYDRGGRAIEENYAVELYLKNPPDIVPLITFGGGPGGPQLEHCKEFQAILKQIAGLL